MGRDPPGHSDDDSSLYKAHEYDASKLAYDTDLAPTERTSSMSDSSSGSGGGGWNDHEDAFDGMRLTVYDHNQNNHSRSRQQRRRGTFSSTRSAVSCRALVPIEPIKKKEDPPVPDRSSRRRHTTAPLDIVKAAAIVRDEEEDEERRRTKPTRRESHRPSSHGSGSHARRRHTTAPGDLALVQAASKVRHEDDEQSASDVYNNCQQVTPVQFFDPKAILAELSDDDLESECQSVASYSDDSPAASSSSKGYQHCFVTVQSEKRLLLLYTFLKKNRDLKVMIFFSSSKSAKFHAELFDRLRIPTFVMHNRQTKEQYADAYLKFSDASSGVLCSTELATTGRSNFQIPPSVDWVVQYEAPSDPTEYAKRLNKIRPDANRVGQALLFLTPDEKGFLRYLTQTGAVVSEFEVPSKVADLQDKIERLVSKSETLSRYAKEAYGSYLMAYARHACRDVYNVHDLCKTDIAKSFGFKTPPALAETEKRKAERRGSHGSGGGSGNEQPLRQRETKSSAKRRQSMPAVRLNVPPSTIDASSNNKDKSKPPPQRSWMKKEKSWKYAHTCSA